MTDLRLIKKWDAKSIENTAFVGSGVKAEREVAVLRQGRNNIKKQITEVTCYTNLNEIGG